MGEYGKRKSDGAEIKFGTCECMYYLRYEDRDKVEPDGHSLDPATTDGLFFRLPFPDEDDMRLGEYEQFNRGERLYRTVKDATGHEWSEDFEDPETIEQPGIIQLSHQAAGLLINLPCYHGHKLPELGGGATAFWNGKGHSLELSSLKAIGGKVKPVVSCRHCQQMWSYQWADILEFIPQPMRDRLSTYALEACQTELAEILETCKQRDPTANLGTGIATPKEQVRIEELRQAITLCRSPEEAERQANVL